MFSAVPGTSTKQKLRNCASDVAHANALVYDSYLAA